ncbi:MAG TPA: DinB family protein [Ktedonobacterales bacterium]
MNDSDYFADQLRVTAEQFAWAALQIPDARRFVAQEGRWCAARVIFHITNYERLTVAPSMRLWEGGPPVDDSPLDDEPLDWERKGARTTYDDLISAFRAGRADQIALASRLVGRWDETRDSPWTLKDAPPITLRWVVTKTLQHTFEHSDELLRIRLYTDMHDTWLKSSRSSRDP